MPNVTLSIEDNSPLIEYSPGEWAPGRASPEEYSQGNYMTTNITGAQASFIWTGSAVEVFGAKRPGHGQYQTKVGDQDYPLKQGSSDTDVFQTSLWSLSWARLISRTLFITKVGSPGSLDIDSISWTFPVGEDNEEVIVNTFQANDPSFRYRPSDAWRNDPPNLSSFSGGSGRIAYLAGSSFEFDFEGDAVALYGPVGPTGAKYTAVVSTDRLESELNANKVFYRPNVMLYHKAGLGPGRHTVNVTIERSEQSGSEVGFAIDYAQVWTAPSLGGKALGFTNESDAKGLSTGASIGIGAGIVVGALLLAFVIGWLVLMWRARRKKLVLHFGFLDPNAGGVEKVVEPFSYSTLSAASPSPPVTSAGDSLLRPQASHGTLMTPHSTQWPTNSSQQAHTFGAVPIHDHTHIHPSNSTISTTQTQEVVIPSRGIEKLRREQTPQLHPPPQGQRSRQGPLNASAQQSFAPVMEDGTSPSDYSVLSPAPPLYTYTDPIPQSATIPNAQMQRMG